MRRLLALLLSKKASISKELENRMDESNYMAARKVRGPPWISKPWVETVMAEGAWAGSENNKKRVSKDPLGKKGPMRPDNLTQTGNVIRNRFDFTVIHLGSNHGHLRIIFSDTVAISHQLC